jgi:hypothetical protein
LAAPFLHSQKFVGAILRQGVKIVLQNILTRLFYAEGNRWVTYIDQAMTFNHVMDANRFGWENRLKDTEIVMQRGISETRFPCR